MHFSVVVVCHIVFIRRSYSDDYCRQLSQDDATRRELARSYRRCSGILRPKREPSLDMHPDLMPIIDTVVLTFVYVERLRMDKDEQRKQAAASGGGP